METLLELASDEVIKKFNALTDPTRINVMNHVLEQNLATLTYLDSTFLRDLFELDLNKLVTYFPNKKNMETQKTIRAINNTSLKDMNEEEWKDIIDYEGIYKISNFGRIKSLRRLYEKTGWIKYREECILKTRIVNISCLVSLSKFAKLKCFKVKDLVATHFLLNPNNFQQVSYINGDYLNNRVSNLEWVEKL